MTASSAAGGTGLRVAYTFEQCWHGVPGGTAVAAVEVAGRLTARDDVELLGVAGRHRHRPRPPFEPPVAVAALPLGPSAALYEAWLRTGHPRVERATGPVDVTHATGLVPAPTVAPLVVTVHDVAFLHEPERFTAQGRRVMRRSLDVIRQRARLVITSSEASRADLAGAGLDPARLRVVRLGVEPVTVTADDVEALRRRRALPERFVLFVGTLEPRKNLRRLAAATARLDVPLVVAGPGGWGAGARPAAGGTADVRFLGFVGPDELPALYASASVFAYPSEREGFGLPVAEAMAAGTPVVTSAGRATEEVAGGAAVLVDPLSVGAIADGIARAEADNERLVAAGRARAAGLTWEATAAATVTAYREAVAAGPVVRRRARPHRPSAAPGVRDARLRVGVNLLWCRPGRVGGSEEYLVRQLTGLAAAAPELEVGLFVLPGFAEAHPELAPLVRAVAPSAAGRRARRVLAEATWLPRRVAACDVVHHGGGTLPARTPRPTVLTLHDLQWLRYPQYVSAVKLRYLRAVVPASVRRAGIVAVPSEYVKRTVVDAYGRDPAGVVVVPHGVDPPEMATSEVDVRRRFGLGDRPFVVYPAMTHPHKGHAFLLDVLASAPAGTRWADPDLALVLLGRAGAAQVAVTAAIERLGLAGRVVRPGRVIDADRDGLLAAAEALVFPSEYEGFGAPVLEAMVAGTPVLCSDRAALPEVAGHAAVVRPLRLDAWITALDEVATRRQELVTAGRDRAARFTTAASGAALASAYRLAAARPSFVSPHPGDDGRTR